jgi:phosphoribosylpyrophosphate synthetase
MVAVKLTRSSRRSARRVAEIGHVIGDVKGKTAVIDDSVSEVFGGENQLF